MSYRFRGTAAGLLLLASLGSVDELVAQHTSFDAQTAWVGEFATLSANALLGGLTAGVMQKVRGGSFQDGFTRGALGGGIIFAGKRISVERFDGAGLLGRQVAAIGSSVIANAAEGRGSLDHLVLPAGPLRVYVVPGRSPRIRAKVDLHTLFWTGYGILEPELEFDFGASLSAGTAVFRAPSRTIVWKRPSRSVGGLVVGSVIMLSDPPPGEEEHGARVFAHERVHVLQYDQVVSTWVDPLEDWLLPLIPGGDRIGSYVNILSPLVVAPFYLVGDYHSRPWEIEAEVLAR